MKKKGRVGRETDGNRKTGVLPCLGVAPQPPQSLSHGCCLRWGVVFPNFLVFFYFIFDIFGGSLYSFWRQDVRPLSRQPEIRKRLHHVKTNKAKRKWNHKNNKTLTYRTLEEWVGEWKMFQRSCVMRGIVRSRGRYHFSSLPVISHFEKSGQYSMMNGWLEHVRECCSPILWMKRLIALTRKVSKHKKHEVYWQQL